MLKIIILLLAIASIAKAYKMFRDRSLGIFSVIFLAIFWLIVNLLVFNLDVSNKIANFLGIGRGADSMFFISIVLLFIVAFKLYQKIEKVDSDLTKLTCETSKMFHKLNKPQ